MSNFDNSFYYRGHRVEIKRFKEDDVYDLETYVDGVLINAPRYLDQAEEVARKYIDKLIENKSDQ